MSVLAMTTERYEEKKLMVWCRQHGLRAIKLGSMLQPDLPDRLIVGPVRKHANNLPAVQVPILFLELKVGNNTLTPKQKLAQEDLRARGYQVETCWGAREAAQAIIYHFHLDDRRVPPTLPT